MSGVLGSWRATYTPGAWLVLCGPTSAVVLEPADASWSGLVETLWDEVVASSSIGDLAARLASYRIDTMPSFAAFFWGPGGMRSLVRGAVRVVDADTDQVVADGDGVQTWTEVGLPGLTRVRVDLPTDHDPSAFPLPLVVGAVGASSLLLDARDEVRASSPQEALPLAEEAADDADEGWAEEGQDSGGGDDEGGDETPVEDEGAATQLVDPFDDDDENASTALMSAPPALPRELDPVDEHENADTRWMEVPPELGAAHPAGTDQAYEAEPPGPTVAAVFCDWDHPNPPGAPRCRICQAPLGAQAPREVPQPVLAVLRASNGDVVEVQRPVLVGRAPSRDRSSAPDPELLTVSSPSHDISRTHLEVAPAGWDLTVTDLHSTNGTVLVAPDGRARQLEPGETVVVALGTAIELADGISVVVDFPQ